MPPVGRKHIYEYPAAATSPNNDTDFVHKTLLFYKLLK